MKAKTEFVANFKDIEQAHQLGYDVPEPETTIIDFNFDVKFDKDIIAALDKHINK
jgi:hypothetical protein